MTIRGRIKTIKNDWNDRWGTYQTLKVGKKKENMFFVFGVSAFLQGTENLKDFKLG